jgi:hypothetical protein
VQETSEMELISSWLGVAFAVTIGKSVANKEVNTITTRADRIRPIYLCIPLLLNQKIDNFILNRVVRPKGLEVQIKGLLED